MMSFYKSPLNLYVLWHSSFREGKKYATTIYNTFCRNGEKPLGRSLGIPTFFRSEPSEKNKTPIDIPFNEADRNAIIVLVDEHMFNDIYWESYISSIMSTVDGNASIRVYAVSMYQYATYFCEDKLSDYQFIKLEKIGINNLDSQYEERWTVLKNRLLHDLARQMLNQKSIAELIFNTKVLPEPPVRLFISHAKKDGEQTAKQFRDYLNSETKLKTFFDTNDIADGYEFSKQITESFDEHTALVVFQTDEYSDREWCRVEVLTAKRMKCPIVVVYAITNGETRSFPYMGNVPTIRWENNFESIIELTLNQLLSNRFNREYLSKHVALNTLKDDYKWIELTSPPELFNYLDILKQSTNPQLDSSHKPVIVIYPDPPLGVEELRILNEVDDNIYFTTPTYTFQLPLK